MMYSLFISLLLIVLSVGSIVSAQAGAPAVSSVVRMINGDLREMESRLQRMTGELSSLPEIPPGPKGGTLGYHAKPRGLSNADEEIWVQIDLGQSHILDAVAMVPVNVSYGFGDSRNYGFAPSFRVEVAQDAEFQQAHVVADYCDGYPFDPWPAVMIDSIAVEARFVRITATSLWSFPESNRAVFALGEVMVFSEGRNIAPGKIVTAVDSIEGKPQWSRQNLVDNQSALGHPVKEERSATNGFHSKEESVQMLSKWVLIDLGAITPIDEIRIFPARPIDWAESHGFGFPEYFRIEASTSPAFEDPVSLYDRTRESVPNPGDNAIVVPVDGVEARCVRFTATELWQREDGVFVFALAEMQVFADGLNLAKGKSVTASDSHELGLWARAYLVDGYDSQQAIEDDGLGWIRGIVGRQRLLEEIGQLEKQIAESASQVTTRLITGGSVVMLSLMTLVVVVNVRGRLMRNREIKRVRQRIAGDLHDEIGSNLGSIALLSELGADKNEDLAEVNRIARETVDSMQDIAWVIRAGYDELPDLVSKMRDVASTMLRGVEHTFVVTPKRVPDTKVSLNFKRHTLMAFKESLHNILRHSNATAVLVRISINRRDFEMEITDNGCGLADRTGAPTTGAGLKSMEARANALGGTMAVESTRGEGTTVKLFLSIDS